MEKTSTNMLRLLSIARENMNGVSGSALKFMKRRGLTGLSPETTRTLISKGMLPDAKAILGVGNKRGTLNMFKWTPTKYGRKGPWNFKWEDKMDPRRPLKSLKFDDNLGHAMYGVDPLNRKAVIPDLYKPTSGLQENFLRSVIGRHKAREWFRSNAAMTKGNHIQGLSLPGQKGNSADMFRIPEVGSSHMPGVIHDERVFYNGTRNRLGSPVKFLLGKTWRSGKGMANWS